MLATDPVEFFGLNTYSDGNIVLDLLCVWNFIAFGDLVQQ